MCAHFLPETGTIQLLPCRSETWRLVGSGRTFIDNYPATRLTDYQYSMMIPHSAQYVGQTCYQTKYDTFMLLTIAISAIEIALAPDQSPVTQTEVWARNTSHNHVTC